MHTDTSKLIIGLLIAAFVIFRIYTRVRRSIGRQKLQPFAQVLRALALAALCGLFLSSPLMTRADLAWSLAGTLLGIGLAAYALLHTKVEATPEGRFYTGHPIIGLFVASLLIVRIGFRMIQAYATISAGTAPPRTDPLAAALSSPTTLAVFFLMAGYYVLYGAGVLMKARDLKAVTAATPSPMLPSAPRSL